LYDTAMTARRQDDPRTNQKARTRAAIVAAAQQLHGQGEAPTVAQAAEAAGVSRATAYRYFPTQEALLVDLEDVMPGVAHIDDALDKLKTEDVDERLRFLLDTVGPVVLREEAQQRRALWVYLDTWLRNHRNGGGDTTAVRAGSRMPLLDKVLKPLHDVPDEQRRRLQAALALTVGIDSIVIMKDVCRLDDEEALEVLQWAATALLHTWTEEQRAV
jgi:AcrR family transcriptional regulator